MPGVFERSFRKELLLSVTLFPLTPLPVSREEKSMLF